MIDHGGDAITSTLDHILGREPNDPKFYIVFPFLYITLSLLVWRLA